MQALLDAADRGVRVRFLVDDVFTTVPDKGLALLDVHQNIEIRIFNLVKRPGPKPLGLLVEFPRTNRRMHNTSSTVESAATIVGEGNIALEYFQIQPDYAFADVEMLLTGPAVEDMEQAFDPHWSDAWTVPIGSLRERLIKKPLKMRISKG